MSSKLALVTGGVGGIGSAICQALAEDGYTVVANYTIHGSETKWLEGMRSNGYADVAHVAHGDVSDFDAMATMVSEIEADIGPIDVLILRRHYPRCPVLQDEQGPVGPGHQRQPQQRIQCDPARDRRHD